MKSRLSKKVSIQAFDHFRTGEYYLLVMDGLAYAIIPRTALDTEREYQGLYHMWDWRYDYGK